MANSLGVANLPAVVVPHPLGGISVKEVQAKADAATGDIMSSVSQVGEAEKLEIPSTAVYPAATIKVRGTMTDVFREFYERNWTDGLPIRPPTRELVEEMLQGTSHKADEVVGELAPQGGFATVERIAINAVMAGCRPRYLPVVLASVEAIADPENNMAGWAATTGANSPLLIVNGPIRDELEINYGTNALGTGRQANATIGRAINLMTRNIGGAIPGTSDMTTIGAAWEVTNCLAENEAALPAGWEPLNVERGFPKHTSTVSVKAINSQIDIFGHAAREFRQILDTVAAGIVGINNLGLLQGMELVLAFGPEAAVLATQDGWSKQEVRRYVFDKAKQSLRDWKRLGDNIQMIETFPEAKTESDDTMMRMILKPEDIVMIVVGGPGKHSAWWPGGQGKTVTRSIDRWRRGEDGVGSCLFFEQG